MDGRAKYRRDGSGRGNMPPMTTMTATPSTAPTTNVIYGGTKYHCDGRQHIDLDDCYLESGSDNGDGDTNYVSDDETSNKYW